MTKTEKDFNEYHEDTVFHWTDGMGYVELQMTASEASRCSHPGRCDESVEAEIASGRMTERLNAINPEDLSRFMSENSDWETDTHEDNLRRLLWIAAGDIQFNPQDYI